MHGGGATPDKQDDKLSDSAFVTAFGDLVARRDFSGAMALCRVRLKAKPEDRYALEMRDTVQHFLDATQELQEDEEEEEDQIPPQLEEMQESAVAASTRAFEAMFAYLQEDEERLWHLGEQAVGIFWDVGQISQYGHRDRLREMSTALLATLARKLRCSGGPKKQPGEKELGSAEWLFEALGQLWWYSELDLVPEDWLVETCQKELASNGSSMQALVGYSAEGLREAPYDELCDILTQTWTLERSVVCGLFGNKSVPSLEYGVAAVFAEIRRRPLMEPPLEGFYDCFYLMTHVVYILNCFNGHLPNRRADCPWVYSYLERCLNFWLREVRRDSATKVSESIASELWSADGVDAIAEAADTLLGLGEPTQEGATGEAIREAVHWLLGRQEDGGLFFSPGAPRDASDEYNHLHPSWTAAAALQLERQAPGPSPRCAAWARHARAAAQQAGLGTEPAPPTMASAAVPSSERQLETLNVQGKAPGTRPAQAAAPVAMSKTGAPPPRAGSSSAVPRGRPLSRGATSRSGLP